jgi:hypothetical protein
MVRDRATQAGLGKVYPHIPRHAFPHHWLMNGGQETDLMLPNGWKARSMVQRYAASTAGERARGAHDRFSPVMRL